MKKLLLLYAIGTANTNLQAMKTQKYLLDLMRQQAQEELIKRCEEADVARTEMVIDHILMEREASSPGIIARTFTKRYQKKRSTNMRKFYSIIKTLQQKAREYRTVPPMAIDEKRGKFKLATRIIHEKEDLVKKKDRLMRKIEIEDRMFYEDLRELNKRFGK